MIAKAAYLLNSLYGCMVLYCVLDVKADDIYGFVFVEIHNPLFYFFYCVFLLCCDFTFLQGHKDYDKFTNCDFPGNDHAIKQLQK